MTSNLDSFTDVLGDADEIDNSQPISLSPLDLIESLFKVSNTETTLEPQRCTVESIETSERHERPKKHTGQHGDFRSVEEIDEKYRGVFSYPYFNLVQSGVIEDALYSDKSMVVCAPTGSGKTVVFEMAIVQLLMALEDRNYTGDFKIIYMAPVKALCTERLTEWYPKFTRLGLLCIEVTGDTDVDFSQLKSYRIIITTPEKWDMLTRRWRDHHRLVGTIKLFLIDEVHILNDQSRGPVLEAVVSRMKTIEASSQSTYRIEQLQRQYANTGYSQQETEPSEYPRVRFVAVSATVSNPEDVAAWLGTDRQPAVYYKFGDECRPVRLKRVVEGYPCAPGCSPFKFDIILNYKLWPIINKYHDGKPTLIFCNTRKSVALTAETLAKEITVSFSPEQKAKLAALASTIKNKKLQSLIVSGVGCHHAGLLFEERQLIEASFRSRDLPILITTTTLAMGVNLPAHLVIIKNTQQYVNGQYQEYSISTVLQMVGRAGRPQFDSDATAVIMTTTKDKFRLGVDESVIVSQDTEFYKYRYVNWKRSLIEARYQALVEGDEPLQSYLHKRLPENLNSEAALGTVTDVAQCVQWLRSTFLCVRAAKDPKRYLGLPPAAPAHLITKKLEELCVCAMNGLASAGLIAMDEASCIESTEAGRLMSVYYIDLETMKHIMKIKGTETLEQLVWILCESHELADMHLRVDERRCLNALNRNNSATTIRYPMKGKINSRQMKLNCVIQAVLGCLPIPEPALHQEAAKVMRVADRLCKCLVAYVTRSEIVTSHQQYYAAVFNSLTLAKCITAQLWDNSPYVSKQLRGIGPTFSALLASAGKVNFMLLEESHPRDLERIMNKGPPLGNILRKQVSLLPRYQLTATPRDQSTVTLTLLLINQAYLSENIDNLTAGDSHRCHIVVGDSENYLLLLTSFKDKDLISMYDGSMTYEITRMHNFEHKIFVHCISSKFVGIDAQCEYTFKDLAPAFSREEPSFKHPTQELKQKTPKQTSITDTFKERKRKNNESDIAQSKEKKKRDTALMDKFKHLKESFGITTKEIKDDLHKTSEMTDNILNNTFVPKTPFNLKASNDQRFNSAPVFSWAVDESTMNTNNTEPSYAVEEDHNKSVPQNHSDIDFDYPEMILDPNEDESLNVDVHVEDILNKIETEISKSRDFTKSNPKCEILNDFATKDHNKDVMSHDYKFAVPKETVSENCNRRPRNNTSYLEPKTGRDAKSKLFTTQDTYKPSLQSRIRKPTNTRSNFSFIEALERRTNPDENEEITTVKESGFSDAIKREIENFINSAKNNTKQTDTVLQELIGIDANGESINTEKIGENRHVDTTVQEIPVSSEVNNNEYQKPSVIDLTDLPDVCINKDLKANIIDLSTLPDDDHNANDLYDSQDDFKDDDHKIKRKSIIETTKWLETENLGSVKTIDLDLYYPEAELRLEDMNHLTMDGDNIKHPETGSDSHTKSIKQSVDTRSINCYIETQRSVENNHLAPLENYGSHGMDVHNVITIYDHNRNRKSKVPTNDIENKNRNINDESYNANPSIIKSGSHADSIKPCVGVNTRLLNYSNKTQLSSENNGSGPLANHGRHGLDIHTIIAVYDHKRNRNSTVPANDTKENETTDMKQLLNNSTDTVKENSFNLSRNSYNSNNHIESNQLVPLNNATLKDHSFYLSPETDSTKTLKAQQLMSVNDINDNIEDKTVNNKDWSLELRSQMKIKAASRLPPQRLTKSDPDANMCKNFSSVIKYPPQNHSIEAMLMNEIPSNNKSKNLQDSSEDQYVNKYSFSATQIDVCTKNTTEEKVQIIRKMKVDLDITEIVSRERNKVQKTDNATHEQRQTSRTQKEKAYDGQHLSLYRCQSSYFHPTSITENRESSPPHNNQYGEDREPQNSINKLKESCHAKAINGRKEILDSSGSTNAESCQMTNIDERNKINSRGSNIPMLTEYATNIKSPIRNNIESAHTNVKEICEDHKTNIENPITEHTHEDSASSHIHNKVQRILDKYMKTMRNNTVEMNSQPDVKPTTKKEPTINKCPEKPKRPFKISDIHKTDIALPKSFEIEVSRSQTPKNEDAWSKFKTIESRGQMNANVTKASVAALTKPINIYKDIIKDYKSDVQQVLKYENVPNEFGINNHTQTPNENESFEEIQDDIPETIADSPLEELSTDYNIDQEMLNPKSLLKRFTEDECENELIIPPPTEFCDNVTNAYSPTLNDNEYDNDSHNINNTEYDFDLEEKYFDSDDDDKPSENAGFNTSHDRSIFEENTHNLLTPSMEIETWTFHTDELEDSKPRKFVPPLKCVTVMRNNPIVKEIAQIPDSRQVANKLSKFRAPTKDKLKL